MGILRFILALSVVVAHSTSILGVELVGGVMAVKTFYIISGFYMTLILNEKYIQKNNSYFLFITNRFIRLFPLYWIVLFITVVFSIVIISGNSPNSSAVSLHQYIQYHDKLSFFSWFCLIASNLLLFGQDLLMFFGLNLQTGNFFFTENFQNFSPALHTFLFLPQAWTIGVELTFYLLAPWITRKSLPVLALGILLSLGLRFYFYELGLNHDPWTYRFFFTELTFFLLGSVSYHIYRLIRDKVIPKAILMSILAAILGLTLFFVKIPFDYKTEVYYVIFFLALPFIFKLTKTWKLDAYIGELSYPIYISHVFIFLLIRELNIPGIRNSGITLAFFTVLFSILVNEIILKKLETIRQKRMKTQSKNSVKVVNA